MNARGAYWGCHHAWKGLGPRFRALEAHRWLGEEEARADLAGRLWGQLQQFAGIPEALPQWGELAREGPSQVFRGWGGLPILTKGDLRERFPVEAILARQGGRANGTGGSTGEPTRFVHDRAMLRCCTATMYYGWRRMGWRPGMPVHGLWGAQRDIGLHLGFRDRCKQGLLAALGGVRLCDGFALDPQRGRAFLRRILNGGAPCAVFGYTSLLDAVARQAEEEGWRVPPGRVAAAWNGGETLFPEQTARFQRVFGVPIQNYYGGRETGAMAFQGQGEDAFQVVRPFIFLELVDGEGRPCGPGAEGRLLVTSTVCRGTPFLRYEIGDLATYGEGQLDRSGLRALRGVHGRVSSTLRLKGREVSSIYWNHLFKDYAEVRAFQVRARGEALHILLEAPGLPEAALGRIRATVLAFLGPLPLELERVETVPRSAAGKLIHVIQEGGAG